MSHRCCAAISMRLCSSVSVRRGRLLLDAQGLVRVPRTGPLMLDADFDPEVLRHVSILKVSEDEADVLAGGDLDALADLGVPEIVLTLGERGSVVIVNGHAEEIPASSGRGRGRPNRRGRRVRERLTLGPARVVMLRPRRRGGPPRSSQRCCWGASDDRNRANGRRRVARGCG